MKQAARAAVSCALFRSPALDEVYLIRRQNNPNKGLLSFPGGRLEFGQRITEATLRELREQTGYQAKIGSKPRVLQIIQPDYHFILFVSIAFAGQRQAQFQRKIEQGWWQVGRVLGLDPALMVPNLRPLLEDIKTGNFP